MSSRPQPTRTRGARSELAEALAKCRTAFVGLAVFSCIVNLLMLIGPIYMMEVYDRVLPSRSVPTLVGLSILAGGLYLFQGILEVIRARVLVRVGTWIEESLAPRIYDVLVRPAPLTRARGDGIQPVRDLEQIRAFSSGLGPTVLFDLPWMPFYLGVCYLFHPWIGLAATGGALVLISLTILTEQMTRRSAEEISALASARYALANSGRRNAEALLAMGMVGRLEHAWNDISGKLLDSQRRANDVSTGFSGASKVVRLLLQSGILGLGAYLVVNDQLTPGIIIASSIMTSRALAPAELAIGHWKGFIAARQSWRRLRETLQAIPPKTELMALPSPHRSLSVENLTVALPADGRVVVAGATFEIKAGTGLGVIGPSASGKSSLIRALVGVWPAARGAIRLDGAALDQWGSDQLGPHIGYLPQTSDLLDGTIAQNISRGDPDAKPDAIIEAARQAGVHDLVLRLPKGYETPVGENGSSLSAGQRQRIALARALFREPFLVVLDEPNSNLDSEGDEALTKAILGVRARGGIAIVVAHRPSALAALDQVLFLAGGQVRSFGPKDEVLRQVMKQDRPAAVAAVPSARAG